MKLLASGFVFLVCASQVLAGTVIIQSSADSPLIGALPTTNRGLGGQHYWGNGDTLLLKFDFAGLPGGKVVKSATVEFFSGHEGGYTFNWQVTARAMRNAWHNPGRRRSRITATRPACPGLLSFVPTALSTTALFEEQLGQRHC